LALFPWYISGPLLLGFGCFWYQVMLLAGWLVRRVIRSLRPGSSG
jgi:hypothetical protein